MDVEEFDIFLLAEPEHYVDENYIIQIIDRIARMNKTIWIFKRLSDELIVYLYIVPIVFPDTVYLHHLCQMHMNYSTLLPNNFYFYPFLKYSENMIGFEISKVFSVRGWGYVGKKIFDVSDEISRNMLVEDISDCLFVTK